MQLSTQAGSTTTNWMADVPGYYRPVWFHPGGIANILSMVNMIAKYRVTYDSRGTKNANQFCVHKEDGRLCIFQQSRRGLCYLDTAKTENHTVLAVTTVETNKSKYTNRDYSRALLARKIQVLVGRPEFKDFLRYIDSHSLPNCPIHRQYAINAHARQQLQAVLGAVANNLPQEIMENYRNVILCIDIMFVNWIQFFLTISKKLHFITAEVLENRKEESLIKALKRVYGVYRKRGFRINNILAGGKFE
jgi:hypothetical protein